jgi:hypothetical protein
MLILSQQVLADTTRRLLEDLDSSGDSMIEFGEFKKQKQVSRLNTQNSVAPSVSLNGVVSF